MWKSGDEIVSPIDTFSIPVIATISPDSTSDTSFLESSWKTNNF